MKNINNFAQKISDTETYSLILEIIYTQILQKRNCILHDYIFYVSIYLL